MGLLAPCGILLVFFLSLMELQGTACAASSSAPPLLLLLQEALHQGGLTGWEPRLHLLFPAVSPLTLHFLFFMLLKVGPEFVLFPSQLPLWKQSRGSERLVMLMDLVFLRSLIPQSC